MTGSTKQAFALTTELQYLRFGDTVQDGRIWLLNSKMNENTDSSVTPSKEFSLQRGKFQPVKYGRVK